MRLLNQDSLDENLKIARENLSGWMNELLWLLGHDVDDPPDQLDPIVLSACRRYLRLIAEDLPPLLLSLKREQPAKASLCDESLATCAHLRRLHPSTSPEVWSATFSAARTLANYIDEVRLGPSSEPAGVRTPQPREEATLLTGTAPTEHEFVLVGEYFQVCHEGKRFTLKNLVGLRCIRELLRQPEKEIFAGELYTLATGKATGPP